MMIQSPRSNVSGGLLQSRAWNRLPLTSPLNLSEQYHLRNTTTHSLPLSASVSTVSSTSISSAPQYPETDGGGFSPNAKGNGRNTIVRTDGDVGYKRPADPSQVGKVDDHPDPASLGAVNHTAESFYEAHLGNSCLSRRKRLLIELRSCTRGWHCPICYQRFKRQDYIRQHVKRKHPECCDGLLYTPSATPDRSEAASARPQSTDDGPLVSQLFQGEQIRYPMIFWDSQSTNLATDSFNFEDAFSGGSMTPQTMHHDSTSPEGRDLLDGLGNGSSSCLETSLDSSPRLLACPFYKRYPLQYRKCSALSLRRPKDVKQHIYRSHTQPEFYCTICYHVFHTATERDIHWRLCDKLGSSIPPKFQGITGDQKRILNEKSPRDLGVEDQWFDIYAIIFPVSEFPKSPYVGNELEEIVPLLREKWEAQGFEITALAVGKLSYDQLSFAMELFFKSLEGETFGHDTVDNSTCTASAQSHMRDDIERDTWSLSSVQSSC